jgi:hypothetical protein
VIWNERGILLDRVHLGVEAGSQVPENLIGKLHAGNAFPRSDQPRAPIWQAASDGYYEEVREVVIIPVGSRSESGTHR